MKQNLPAATDEPKKGAFLPTARVRKALDLMVWQGTKRDDAARATGMVPKSLYNAFRKHHVKAYYLAQLDVLRTSARARNFHRLEAIAEQDDNRMAAVTAIKTMEGLSDAAPSSHTGRAVSPGVVIVINNSPRARTVDDDEVITINPLIADQDADEQDR